ncbi:hypothetical protein VUR80DRAFT_8834 [Thermomyces stellatus]
MGGRPQTAHTLKAGGRLRRHKGARLWDGGHTHDGGRRPNEEPEHRLRSGRRQIRDSTSLPPASLFTFGFWFWLARRPDDDVLPDLRCLSPPVVTLCFCLGHGDTTRAPAPQLPARFVAVACSQACAAQGQSSCLYLTSRTIMDRPRPLITRTSRCEQTQPNVGKPLSGPFSSPHLSFSIRRPLELLAKASQSWTF